MLAWHVGGPLTSLKYHHHNHKKKKKKKGPVGTEAAVAFGVKVLCNLNEWVTRRGGSLCHYADLGKEAERSLHLW